MIQQNKYVDATVLLEIDDVLLINYNPEPKIMKSTTLRVLHLEEQNQVLLMHAEFLYSLHKDLPIFTNTRPDDCNYGRRYVLPNGSQG
jgi:hypothetical protein